MRTRNLIAGITLLVLLMAAAGLGQLSVSGGTQATILAGSAIIGKVGVDQTTPGTTNAVALSTLGSTAVSTGNGTVDGGVLRVAIASNNTAFPVNASLAAGSNIIGSVNTIPKTLCGNTQSSAAGTLQAVPTSATLLTTAATACVVAAIFNNTTGAAVTITLTDNTATPINALLTFSVPALSSLTENLYGLAFNLGVKWTASGAGVTGGVIAFQ